ncbi:MAG: glutathione S-transferase family protein [Hyphomicrobiales bacterium]|nr:glutathione S-transferase family protein [Hyphomicrobiales bacterium]
MYKLFGSLSSRSFRVMWMLEELGLEYEHVAASPRTEEIYSLNPGGKVPVLLVGDEVVTDSSAIIQYLADSHNQLTYATGTIERAKQDSFLHFANDEMDSVCWTVAKHKFVLPKELRVQEVIKACAYEWNNAMKTFTNRLGDNEFVMGEQFTVPDIVITHVIGWAKLYDFETPDSNVLEYFERLRSRPAYQKVSALRKK